LIWFILAVIFIVIAFLVMAYNKLVTLKNRYKNAFAQIDVQLKRRYDLIPNLVETAKAFMSHERDTLEAVIKARNGAMSASQHLKGDPSHTEAMGKLLGAESVLSQSLGRLFALSEAYPDLKSNANMMQLTEELTSTENKIGFARQAYNDAVTSYNTACDVFPNVVIARPLNFTHAMLYELKDESERQPIKVSF
jgi:LemA protein